MVSWDHMLPHKIFAYPVSYSIDDWEKIGSDPWALPDNLRLDETGNVVDKCKHEWVNVGFMHAKMVCKHCDKDQP